MAQFQIKRVLRLRDLLIYGMIVTQVVAPIPVFGLIEKRSGRHAVLTVVLAVLPMLITAVSYGRMPTLYPLAGSAYTYVGRAINPHLGFLIGWSKSGIGESDVNPLDRQGLRRGAVTHTMGLPLGPSRRSRGRRKGRRVPCLQNGALSYRRRLLVDGGLFVNLQ